MTRTAIALLVVLGLYAGALAAMGAEIDLRLGPVRICLTPTTPFC